MWAFSVITNLRMDLYEALDFIIIFTATSLQPPGYPRHIPEMDEMIKTGEQTWDKNPKLLRKFQPF